MKTTFEGKQRLSSALRIRERDSRSPIRALANHAFSRAANAPLVEGNRVRLLKDANENYPVGSVNSLLVLSASAGLSIGSDFCLDFAVTFLQRTQVTQTQRANRGEARNRRD